MKNIFKKFHNRKQNRGYTLIEMMISIGIFLVVVTYGTASILNSYAINKKTQGTRVVLDSLNFVMDDMSRNIRVGFNYRCLDGTNMNNWETANNCTSGSGLAFESSKGVSGNTADQWVYYIKNDKKLYKSKDSMATEVQMTPDEVVIDTIKSSFSVWGANIPSAPDGQQPFVQIKLVGTVVNNSDVTPFSLQTSISQRAIDN